MLHRSQSQGDVYNLEQNHQEKPVAILFHKDERRLQAFEILVL